MIQVERTQELATIGDYRRIRYAVSQGTRGRHVYTRGVVNGLIISLYSMEKKRNRNSFTLRLYVFESLVTLKLGLWQFRTDTKQPVLSCTLS